MPYSAPKPCNKAGCKELTHKTYCPAHTQARQRQYDKQRGTSSQRGYGSKWQRVRKAYLLKHPECVKCKEKGIYKAATDLDHIIPHKGDMERFWDNTNWQGLCKSCHSTKTAQEDGRWS